MTEFLKTQNLTKLAKEIGIARQTLSVIKHGKQEPSHSTLIKFAKALKEKGYNDSEILRIITTK